jgi:hypothetical protein
MAETIVPTLAVISLLFLSWPVLGLPPSRASR